MVAGLAPGVIGSARLLDFLPLQPRGLKAASFDKHMRMFLSSKSILHPAAPLNTQAVW